MDTTAIANHLNVAASAIVEVQEWARVLWVRVRGLGARFVSKKVVEESSMITIQFKGNEAQIPAQDGLHVIPGGALRMLPTYILVKGFQAICMTAQPKTTDWGKLEGDVYAKDIEDGIVFWA